MGKASRWIRSFLLGKKEKHKKIDRLLLSAESLVDLNVLPKATQEKRRWSFKKSFTSPESNTNYKRSRSLDISFTRNTLLVKQTLQDCDVERIRAIVSRAPVCETTGTLAPPELHATGIQEDEAATKIQSFFRSYLARKALRALKGLVKIQALMRGHLVRKQTAAMIKRMQALIAIQIRARIQRVHLNEISQFEYGHRFSHRESLQNHLDIETINRRRRHIGQPQAERREDYHSFRKKYDRSRRHSFSNLQQRHLTPSTWLARQSSPELYKVSRSLSQNKLQEFNTKQTKLPFLLPNIEDLYSFSGSHLFPTYMSNTESSRAKARSKSAPKLRPEWDSKQAGGQGFAVGFIDDERQHPWS